MIQQTLFTEDGTPTYVPPHGKFNGPEYSAAFDYTRLRGQMLRVFDCMKSGRWLTLGEIESATGDPQASISAQMRHLRKPRFNSHVVVKRSRGVRENGLWEYKLVINESGT